MEQGRNLISFLLIGMVLIAFLSFIFIFLGPTDGIDIGKFEIDEDDEIDIIDFNGEEKNEEKEDEEKTTTTSSTSGTSEEKKVYRNELLMILYDYAIPFALLLSYTIVALGFMVAKVFNSREAESWAKIELREVLISTMYATIIISFFPFFNALIDEFSNNTTGLTTDEMFIQMIDDSFEPIKTTIKYLFTFSSANWIGWTPTAKGGILPFIPPIPPLSSPSAVIIDHSHFYDGKMYLNFFNLFAHTFIPILFSAIVSIMGQIVLLNFFEKSLFIFVGLGLAMRSFVFTRRMGGTLLALVLGVFFILKLLLVIQTSIYVNMGLDREIEITGSGVAFEFLDFISDAVTLLLEAIISLFEIINFPMYIYNFIMDCSGGNPFLIALCAIIAPIIFIIDLIIAIGKLIAGIIMWAIAMVPLTVMGVRTLSDAVDGIIIYSIALYSDLIVFAFFMPLLNFIIVMAGVKCLAETFGGDPTIVSMFTFI